MDFFFNNLKKLFYNENFIFLKNTNNFNSEKYNFVYETHYNENKYIVLSYKDRVIEKKIISICIPTYNKDKYILIKALEEWSKSQNINLDFVEFIIVENGSKTYNYDLFEKFNLNIKLIHLEEANLGKARKISVEKANSDLLFLVNDDTIPTEYLIQNHIKYNIEYSDKRYAILGSFDFHKDLLNNNFMKILQEDKNLFFQNSFIDNYISNVFVTNNISIKKEYIIEAGNFSTEFKICGEDNELEYRLKNIKTLFKSELIAYHYHKHDIYSYINLLKNRYFFNKIILSKYKNREFKEVNKKPLIEIAFLIEYINKNNDKDIHLKHYTFLIHYISIFFNPLIESIQNTDLEIKNKNSKVLIITQENNTLKINQSYKNYDIKYINKTTKLYEIINNNYDYFLFIDGRYLLLGYSLELFIILSEQEDKKYKVFFGKTFKINENYDNFEILENYDLFIKRKYLLNSYLLEKNIDKNLFIEIKKIYEYKIIDVVCTSIDLN